MFKATKWMKKMCNNLKSKLQIKGIQVSETKTFIFWTTIFFINGWISSLSYLFQFPYFSFLYLKKVELPKFTFNYSRTALISSPIGWLLSLLCKWTIKFDVSAKHIGFVFKFVFELGLIDLISFWQSSSVSVEFVSYTDYLTL